MTSCRVEAEPTDPLELALKKCRTMSGDLTATVALLTVASTERHPDSRYRILTSRALGSALSMRAEMVSLLEYAK